MTANALPVIPGVRADGVPDDYWTVDHPQWVQATVWAAHDAWTQSQTKQRPISADKARCAACAAPIPDKTADTRCSQCKQVSFCDVRCQRKAFPVHKHWCQPVEDQRFSRALHPALHEAVQEPGNSSNPPFPPSLKKMMDLAERPALTRDQKMLVAFANLTVARYFLHHEDVPQAWGYLQAALTYGKDVKSWSVQNEALLYQIKMCRHLNSTAITQQMLDCCMEGTSLGARHKDLHLQARASHQLGGIQAVYKPTGGGLELLEQSREMWSNMMKAAWKCSQGDAQDLSLQTCACNLVKVLVNMAGTYTFQGQPAESELVLREALQYKDLAGDPLVEFDVLLALANNLELHEESTKGLQSLRDRAGIYREHLVVSMIARMGRNEPKECAVCLEEIDAKQPTLISEGYDQRLVVLPCCHVFHHGCAIKWNKEHFDCPTCRAPLMVFHS